MKRAVLGLLILSGLWAVACSPQAPSSDGAFAHDAAADGVVYGGDSVHNAPTSNSHQAATPFDLNVQASVALIDQADLQISDRGTGQLNDETVEEKFRTCRGTKMGDQITPAFCSGLLIGKDLVLTAGHCLLTEDEENRCPSIKLLFQYGASFIEKPDQEIASKLIYGCKRVVMSGRNLKPSLDFAIIQLDRPVIGVKPVLLPVKGPQIGFGSKLYTIGYPIGTPKKVADGTVRSSPDPRTLNTNLDTFSGNSGSPVFDPVTQTLMGVLIDGEVDFTEKKTNGELVCREIKHCSDNGCLGETVLSVDAILRAARPVLPGLGLAPTPVQFGH